MKNQVSLIEKMQAVVKRLPSSNYKMGDLFTLTVGSEVVKHDTREYYSGRGAKYNSSIRHGNVSVAMTEKELNAAYKPIAVELKAKSKREAANKKYLSNCNKPSQIAKAAAEKVCVVGKSGYMVEGKIVSNNTPVDVYSGCGTYRVGWRAGKITCAVHGGFYGSCPYGVDRAKWIIAIQKEMLKYADHMVKMDGSGCQFFFRDMEDADLVTNAVEIYTVPSAYGGRHLNIVPAFAEVQSQKLLN